MAPQVETQDPLLAELNGALAKTGDPKLIDRAPEQPASLSEQLETAPAGRQKLQIPRANLADKTHSVAKGGHGYCVTVEGEYYARSTEVKGNVTKKYRLPFNLPALSNSKGDAALGIIVGKLLKPALMKLDPLAVTYRTHAIVDVTPLDGAPPPTSLQYMSFDALKEYAKEQDFPVDPEEYWDVADLRNDIVDWRTNQTTDIQNTDGSKTPGGLGSKKTVVERIKERHEARKEEKVLRDMNEGL